MAQISILFWRANFSQSESERQKKNTCTLLHIFPPPLSLTLSCFCSHPLHHLPFTPSPDPTHLCPSANEHQRQGPNPRGSPKPGDYPASSPLLPSAGAALFCTPDPAVVTRDGISGEWGVVVVVVGVTAARQNYPQVHWDISFFSLYVATLQFQVLNAAIKPTGRSMSCWGV